MKRTMVAHPAISLPFPLIYPTPTISTEPSALQLPQYPAANLMRSHTRWPLFVAPV